MLCTKNRGTSKPNPICFQTQPSMSHTHTHTLGWALLHLSKHYTFIKEFQQFQFPSFSQPHSISNIRKDLTKIQLHSNEYMLENICYILYLLWKMISNFFLIKLFNIAAAAAKSLQSCPTLWDPIDSSPPGSSVHRILQARILEWVAISFSNYLTLYISYLEEEVNF